MPDFTDLTREEVVAKVAAGESLEGADLEGVDLQGADLREATYDKHTKFPEDFDPEAAGIWSWWNDPLAVGV